MKTKTGQKHLVKCRCFLPQFSNWDDPPTHEFPVFSVIDENDEVIQKFVQCNNCGIVHKVIGLCQSEIVHKENLTSVTSIDDIKLSLDEKIIEVLDKYEVDNSTWEQVKFIIDNEIWGDFVLLTKDNDKELGLCQGKYVKILKRGVYSVESFAREEFVSI
jgi:hypothetical protein